MIYVTRKMTFAASHRLYNPTFSDQQNEDIYDKCNNYHGHGHNYTLEVTVAGIPNPNTGYLIDLKKLKRIMKEFVVDKVDHKHLNFDVDFLDGVIPSAENMAIKFWEQLEPQITDGKLHKIKLFETENNIVEYYGDKIEVPKFYAPTGD